MNTLRFFFFEKIFPFEPLGLFYGKIALNPSAP